MVSDMEKIYNSSILSTARMLRRNLTKEEKHLWYDFLQKHPRKFVKQKILGKYIADFYCASAKLVVELDGSQHYTDYGMEKDAERTEYLKQFGITVIRISNTTIKTNFSGACQYIDETLNELTKTEQ